MNQSAKLDDTQTTLPIYDIRPTPGWVAVKLGDLWHHRELLYFLTWREVKVRYKQTLLGFAWAVLQPLFMMLIFTLFFGTLANIKFDGPYPLYVYAGLLPWTLFAEGITRSSMSLVGQPNLVQKVYFPRLILPLSGILSPLVDFAIAFLILIGMMFYYGYPPTIAMLWLPVFVLLTVMTALGVGLWLAAINVKYRDVRYVIPFLIQVWLFISPVIYSSDELATRWSTGLQIIYGLNPMAGVIEGFRWAMLGQPPPGYMMAVSVVVTLLLLVSGAYYFRRSEKYFADLI